MTKWFNNLWMWIGIKSKAITPLDEELFNEAVELVEGMDEEGEEEKEEDAVCDHEWYIIKRYPNNEVYQYECYWKWRDEWVFLSRDLDYHYYCGSTDILQHKGSLRFRIPPVDKVCLKCGECHNGWDTAMKQLQDQIDIANADEELAYKMWGERCCND
jgi:hypothetical protein